MTYMETTQASAAREAWLGQTHGYRIAGDLACINAELGLPQTSQAALAQRWALQLWACDQPYRGGVLSGTKVAEAPVELIDLQASQPQHLYAETFARLPAGDRAYSMVLVLASRSSSRSEDADAHEQVHDFANYPALEHFNVPTLRGAVSLSRDAELVTLHAERIENPRGAENLSGSLALELWTLDAPYAPYHGGQFAGSALAGVELGRLAGLATLENVELQLPAAVAAAHEHLTVMLREWTVTGYVTRDFKTLTLPVLVPAPAPVAAREPIASPAPVAVSAVIPGLAPVVSTPTSSAEQGRVSVQEASLDQLAAVPGLSRKLALEIVKARPFRSLEDLTRVRGIGEKTLRKLRALLTL